MEKRNKEVRGYSAGHEAPPACNTSSSWKGHFLGKLECAFLHLGRGWRENSTEARKRRKPLSGRSHVPPALPRSPRDLVRRPRSGGQQRVQPCRTAGRVLHFLQFQGGFLRLQTGLRKTQSTLVCCRCPEPLSEVPDKAYPRWNAT